MVRVRWVGEDCLGVGFGGGRFDVVRSGERKTRSLRMINSDDNLSSQYFPYMEASSSFRQHELPIHIC